MKHLDEYRDPAAAQLLIAEIRKTATRRRVLMEVCGGQTHGLLRYGIDRELEDVVELLHGPGCPVCVTPEEDIDCAVRLAQRPGVVVASFGDMLRVPGTRYALGDARALGGRVRIVYSPVDAVALAQRNPDQHVVFFAVGFETTAPATALAALQAERLGLENFSLLVSHVRVEPAMEAILRAPGRRVEGFLAAGHVCTITGIAGCAEFARRHGVPVVVTGFEPIDLLEGIRDCVRQLEEGRAEATNQYARSVRRDGNRHALAILERVYQIVSCPWRGFGEIEQGGLRLRREYQRFDARLRFSGADGDAAGDEMARAATVSAPGSVSAPRNGLLLCPSAEVLSGRIRPHECPHFGTACSPESPLGAPMVSSEGACSAYFRYHPPWTAASVGPQVDAASRSTGSGEGSVPQ